jgi:hypothetical protein
MRIALPSGRNIAINKRVARSNNFTDLNDSLIMVLSLNDLSAPFFPERDNNTPSTMACTNKYRLAVEATPVSTIEMIKTICADSI